MAWKTSVPVATQRSLERLQTARAVVSQETRKPARRSSGLFAAAKSNRLMADWMVSPVTSVQASRMSLPTLRRRSRQLANDNDYARRFLQMVEQNVAGPRGFKLQVRGRLRNGKLDRRGNETVELHFKRWGQRGVCTMDGRMSWGDVCRKIVRHLARDGEVFIRLVTTNRNAYRSALSFIDPERIDHDYNEDRLANGNRVYMGVEVDAWFRPVAYHIRTYDDLLPSGLTRVPVPASEILHLYVVDYEDQVRGTPWMHSAMARLHMLGGYEQAELVAARTAAAKMGFFKTPDGAMMPADGEDDEGRLVTDAEPGTFETLPVGYDFVPFDPQHPTTAFAPFSKMMLRGVASGFGVTYNGLANDLEGVNFSSMRQGALDERDGWRVTQEFTADGACQVIYVFWLRNALAADAMNLPIHLFDRYAVSHWQARGWQWVDPQKEVNASIAAIGHGLNSRTRVLAERGADYEEIIDELRTEQEIARDAGVSLGDNFGGMVDASNEDDPDGNASA